MRIIGPDEVVFGADNLDDCRRYLLDYGLDEKTWSPDTGGTFVALDNTGITVKKTDDPTLPGPLASGTSLRQTVYGVEDQASVDEIAAELSKDREVTRAEDGSITCEDDLGFALKFQVTCRIALNLEPELINSPGAAPLRGFNKLGAVQDAPAKPRTLSHTVYFTPDMRKMEKFYIERLKFVETDRFENVGPFLKPQACIDHHTLFLLQSPPHMQGMEHLAFHMQGPTDLLLAGSRFVKKGYESFWGPGRHIFGSNWFWYFNSPFGTHFEYDADMDLHDENWVPRTTPISAEAGQIFLFENVEKWFPGAPEND